ncbi:hypothetical protein GWI33_003295 [Rhynchophorus ferrugineus]|uniref:Uncharacterized protein n=1 Tax=Rhynchophorus ferrugineus TaxID=354439 RepID=A0A834IM81_RHYFE|nr:hypothetical protein GWI33_003295 [Rhynchophorus ferrugineus]
MYKSFYTSKQKCTNPPRVQFIGRDDHSIKSTREQNTNRRDQSAGDRQEKKDKRRRNVSRDVVNECDRQLGGWGVGASRTVRSNDRKRETVAAVVTVIEIKIRDV